MSQSQRCSTNCSDRPIQSDQITYRARHRRHFAFGPGISTREDEDTRRFGGKIRRCEIGDYLNPSHTHDPFRAQPNCLNGVFERSPQFSQRGRCFPIRKTVSKENVDDRREHCPQSVADISALHQVKHGERADARSIEGPSTGCAMFHENARRKTSSSGGQRRRVRAAADFADARIPGPAWTWPRAELRGRPVPSRSLRGCRSGRCPAWCAFPR